MNDTVMERLGRYQIREIIGEGAMAIALVHTYLRELVAHEATEVRPLYSPDGTRSETLAATTVTSAPPVVNVQETGAMALPARSRWRSSCPSAGDWCAPR